MSAEDHLTDVAALSDEHLRLLHISVGRETMCRKLPLSVGEVGEQFFSWS
jgi:hypothetical protein